MMAIDHLVLACPRLDWAIDDMRRRLGVTASPGGRHPGLGTHNAIIALGSRCYLELLSPIDAHGLAPALAPALSHTHGLFHWAVANADLPELDRRARSAGLETSGVVGGVREMPDGQRLEWQLLFLCAHSFGAALPFFIDWGSCPHPAEKAPSGGRLAALTVTHPRAGSLNQLYRALGVALQATTGPIAALEATLDGRLGRCALRSPEPLPDGIRFDSVLTRDVHQPHTRS